MWALTVPISSGGSSRASRARKPWSRNARFSSIRNSRMPLLPGVGANFTVKIGSHSCRGPSNQPGDDLAFGFLHCLQHLELLGRKVILNRLLNNRTQPIRLNCVEFNGNVAESF